MYTTPDLSRQHLPLIMCPDCGEVQVETNISGVEGPNEGKRFYKCPIDNGPEKCGWFKWEDAYAAILRRRQAAAPRAQNVARQQVANYVYQAQMPVVQEPPVMPVQIPVPQAPPVPLVLANARGGPNWLTIALMVNTTVNIIFTMALIGRTWKASKLLK